MGRNYGVLPRPVATERTKKEAMAKARKYIKPGHRKVVKVAGGYEVWAVARGSF